MGKTWSNWILDNALLTLNFFSANEQKPIAAERHWIAGKTVELNHFKMEVRKHIALGTSYAFVSTRNKEIWFSSKSGPIIDWGRPENLPADANEIIQLRVYITHTWYLISSSYFDLSSRHILAKT